MKRINEKGLIERVIGSSAIESTNSGNYIRPREAERKEIKSLLKLGHQPIYYRNYIVLNGNTFNGWNKEDIEKLEKE